MEHIDGTDIESYIDKYPENINDIFKQVISGFTYLEDNEILHRDIRPYNIMITNDGVVKIIDFGFGKKIHYEEDFDKSITLNWWCDVPNDFQEKKYNFQTEIYFIGKLFEKIIIEKEIEYFQYKELLSNMTPINSSERIKSFSACNKALIEQMANEIKFNDFEIEIYRQFSNTLFYSLSKIEYAAKFINDSDQVIKKLDKLHTKTMLEEYLPTVSLLIACFINGTYYYQQQYKHMSVIEMNNFIQLLKNSSQEKRNIILNNLETKLEAIERYSKNIDIDEDEIPF